MICCKKMQVRKWGAFWNCSKCGANHNNPNSLWKWLVEELE